MAPLSKGERDCWNVSTGAVYRKIESKHILSYFHNKKDRDFQRGNSVFLVRAKGLEPPCTRRRILNPVRLPIPPRSHELTNIIILVLSVSVNRVKAIRNEELEMRNGGGGATVFGSAAFCIKGYHR